MRQMLLSLICASAAFAATACEQTTIKPPSEILNLSGWYLSIPVDEDNDGKSDNIYENDLAAGFARTPFFVTSDAGGIVFRAPVSGAKTSKNTKYTRSELREMLREGDISIPTAKAGANNWVISSASDTAKAKAGAIGGRMDATVSVDHVTTTGEKSEIGRVIIGQIHGWKNEPVRLYYRLLPGHEKGSLYFAHESQTGQAKKLKDTYFDLIGSRTSDAQEPNNGIALGERFSYRIDLAGNDLSVAIFQHGEVLAEHTLDISNSGYGIDAEYLYFKAGVYNQNKTGEATDYVQATFYDLKVTH